MTPIYYPDHAERHPGMGPRERALFPDAIQTPSGGIIRREKNFDEMTHDDYCKYGVEGIRLAAKDIPINRATIYR